jgi:hypothetical protein
MADPIMYVFLGGFLGGLIRGLIGVTKYICATPSKRRKYRKDVLLLSLATSGGLGLMAGVFIATDVRFAILAGYAGTDFLENLLKIKMKRTGWEAGESEEEE